MAGTHSPDVNRQSWVYIFTGRTTLPSAVTSWNSDEASVNDCNMQFLNSEEEEEDPVADMA